MSHENYSINFKLKQQKKNLLILVFIKQKMSWLLNGIFLGTKLRDIKRNELADNRTDCLTIRDFKLVGSYNWSKASRPNNPIIIVPGKADGQAKKSDRNQTTTLERNHNG